MVFMSKSVRDRAISKNVLGPLSTINPEYNAAEKLLIFRILADILNFAGN